MTDAQGRGYRAFAYYALQIDPALRPYHWYREHVLRGALEHDLPKAYIAAIRAVESIGDPESGRVECELAIYAD